MLRTIIIILISVIILSNILPIDKVISNGPYFRYSNNDGSVTFAEFKSRDFEMMDRHFNSYREKVNFSDSTMYRLFRKSPLAFWRWGQYLFSKRYKLPYKDWSEINAVRGRLTNKTGFQDF